MHDRKIIDLECGLLNGYPVSRNMLTFDL